jgi:hypothetical protein
MNTVKFLLMLINFLTLLSGVLLLALAIYGMTAQARTTNLYSSSVPTWILVLSIFLIIASVMGFYGTTKENTNALRTYLGLVMVLFAVQLILGAIALARVNQIGAMMFDAWDDAYVKNPDTIRRIERAFQCCGYASLLDRPVPEDCSVNRAFGFVEPCQQKVVSTGKDVLKAIGTTLMIVAILEALAMFLAFTFYWHWPENYERDASSSDRLSEARQLLREGSNPSYQPVSRA